MKHQSHKNTTVLVRGGLLAAWLGCLAWLSLDPHPPTVPDFLAWDKLQHAGAYAVLTLLAGYLLALLVRSHVWGWWLAALLSTTFGVLMEIAQWWMSRGRFAEAGDVAADALGAVTVCLGVLYWYRRRGLAAARARGGEE